MMNISFSPPDITEAEIKEVVDALKSGWITTGPRVKKLEKLIAAFVEVGLTENGIPRCVCLNSQTSCAELALHVLGVGALCGGSCEDEVIVPAYTYTASASVVNHVGAKLVLIDSAKDSIGLDYDAVYNAINEHTKAIIPVDIGGVPCDYDRLSEIVDAKKTLFNPNGDIQKAIGRVIILADAAHALGAEYKGKKVGSVADFSAFSFHAVKNLTTGEGGALVWKHIDGVDDENIYKTLQLLSLHGQSKDALAKTRLGAWEYDVVAPWYKCNMTDIAAAMGLAQFKRLPGLLHRRKEIIERYDAAFKPLGVKSLPHFMPEYSSSGHLYITRLFNKDGTPINNETRNAIMDEMAKRGIACNVHYKPLPMHTAYKNLGYDIKNFPNAYSYFINEITLPLNTCLTDEEIEYIIANYCDVVKRLCK